MIFDALKVKIPMDSRTSSSDFPEQGLGSRNLNPLMIVDGDMNPAPAFPPHRAKRVGDPSSRDPDPKNANC